MFGSFGNAKVNLCNLYVVCFVYALLTANVMTAPQDSSSTLLLKRVDLIFILSFSTTFSTESSAWFLHLTSLVSILEPEALL